MREGEDRRIDWDEAARLIYQTKEPTVVQVNKVGYRVARGVLKGDVKGKWVELESVVTYLAARSEKQRMEKSGQAVGRGKSVSASKLATSNASRSPTAKIPQQDQQEFAQIYRQSVHDYFSAVFRRHYPPNATSLFRAAVTIGQIGVILLPLIVIAYGYATMTAPPPEQAAIERWLEKEVGEYQIEKWFPPEPYKEGPGKSIRVKYRYFTRSRKPIVTDRVFLVNGDHVKLLSNTGVD